MVDNGKEILIFGGFPVLRTWGFFVKNEAANLFVF